MEALAFTKMEGAGNDYVYVDGIHEEFDETRGSKIAQLVADRRFGIGSDGLIVLAPSTIADVRMLMWNADGSRGSMCGNGVRCVAKLASDLGLVAADEIRVETDAGVREIVLLFGDDGEVDGARVEMGAVTIDTEPRSFAAADRTWPYHAADAGNPHAVVFVGGNPSDFPLRDVGAAAQELSEFPDGVNLELVEVVDKDAGRLRQRTFERGSGETLACGSGATAVACVAMDLGLVPGPVVTVELLGGELVITREGDRIFMEGPARTVFHGEIELPSN